jgi:hypothetical protein
MPLERSMSEIFGAFGDALKNDIRKVIPATVTAVNPSRQTVDCQVAVHNVLFDDLGNVVQDDAPAFSDVPLACMRGGGFLVWLPVTVGDSVLLVFSDLSTDTWRAGDGNPQPPGWVGKHTTDSPFAIPAFAPDAKFLASPDPNKVVIGKDGAAAQIKISATDIELGNAVTDAVGLASKIDSAVTTIVTAFNSHIHGGVTTGPGSSGPPVPLISPSPPSVASTLVKAQ